SRLERAVCDDVDDPREHPRRVGGGLATADLRALRGDDDRIAAELVDGDFERDPRAGRSLVEQKGRRTAGHRLRVIGRATCLVEPLGQIQKLLDATRAEIGQGQEITLHTSALGRPSPFDRRSETRTSSRTLTPSFSCASVTTSGGQMRSAESPATIKRTPRSRKRPSTERGSRPGRSGTARRSPAPRSGSTRSECRSHRAESAWLKNSPFFFAPSTRRSSSRTARTVSAALDASALPPN